MPVEKLLLEGLYLLRKAGVFGDLTLDSILHDRDLDTETVRLCLDLSELLSLASDKRLFLSELLPLRDLARVRPCHLRCQISMLVPVVASLKGPGSDGRLL